jgi:hypothetical protein
MTTMMSGTHVTLKETNGRVVVFMDTYPEYGFIPVEPEESDYDSGSEDYQTDNDYDSSDDDDSD